MRHVRYLCVWETNEVQIDVSHFQEIGSKKRTFDLDGIRIACGGDSPYAEPQPLGRFPNFQAALKLAINATLERNHQSDTGAAVAATVRSCRWIFSWLVQQGIYQLSDVEPVNVEDLVSQLSGKSWPGVMRQRKRLLLLARRIQTDGALAIRIAGQSRKASFFTVNLDALEQELGIPVGDFTLPTWFRRWLAALVRDARPAERTSYKLPIPTSGELKQTMRSLNLLALQPAPHDTISFYPFHNIEASAQSLLPTTPRQTPNLSPPECSIFLQEVLRWQYDYGPHILSLVRSARTALLQCRDDLPDSRTAVKKVVLAAHHMLMQAGLLPGPALDQLNKGQHTLTGLVETAMAAALAVVGICHARRPNEVVGEDVPYGAYFGCLSVLRESPPEYQIEFYVEKGIQDYRSFPANKLVADAIDLLEAFYLEFRDLDASVPTYSAPRTLGRKHKLFVIRNFTLLGFRSKPVVPSFRRSIDWLMQRVGIDPARWHGAQTPFRRVYCVNFVRRYDLVEIPALQAELGHLTFLETIPYAIDTTERAPGRSIAEMYSSAPSAEDVASTLRALKEAREEYMVELVLRLFQGTSTGGIFPRLILAMAKRLSASADFKALSMERKAARVSEKLKKRGYAVNELGHTVCAGDRNRHTVPHAACHRDGQLHREEASPVTCSGCIHSWSNENYLQAVEAERDRLDGEARDRARPSVLRDEAKRLSSALSDLLAHERQLAAANKEKVLHLVESWNRTVLES
jgi:hypothetical protein